MVIDSLVDVDLGTVVDGGVGNVAAHVVYDVCHYLAVGLGLI